MKGISRRLLVVVFVTIMILIVPGWLVMSQGGLRWLTDVGRPYLPTGVTAGDIRGSLIDVIELSEIRWQSDGVDVRVTDLVIDCDWLAFIYSHYQCRAISSQGIVVNTFEQESAESTGSLEPLEALSPIETLVNLSIAEMNIKQLHWQRNQALGSETLAVLDDISISQLNLAKNRLDWQDAQLTTNQLRAQVKGSVTPLGNWPVTIEALLSFSNNRVNVAASGALFAQTEWAVKTSGLFETTTQASVAFRDGKPLLKGIIDAKEQELDSLYPSLKLMQLKIPVTLDWLTAESEINARFSLAGDEINVVNQVFIEDVLHWDSGITGDGTVTMALSTEQINNAISLWTQGHIKALRIEPGEKDITAQIKSNYTFNNGRLFAENQFAIENLLQGLTKLQFDLVDQRYENLSLQGSVEVPWLADHDDASITRLVSDFSVNQATKESDIQYQISGAAEELTSTYGSLQGVRWQLGSDAAIRGFVHAREGQFEFNGSDMSLTELKITLDGVLQAHDVTIKSALNNVDVMLAFQGTVPGRDIELYQATRLQVQLNLDKRQVDLSLKTLDMRQDGFQIDTLCLENIGQICGSVMRESEQIQAQASADNFSMTELTKIADEIGIDLPVRIEGLISGDITLAQSANQLQMLDVALSSPLSRIKTGDVDISLEQLKLNSVTSNTSTDLDFQWAQLNSVVNLDSTILRLASPAGKIQAQLADLHDITATLSLPDNTVTLETMAVSGASQTEEDSPAKVMSLSVPEINITGNYNAQTLQLISTVALQADDHLHLDITTTWPVTHDSQIDATLNISVTQFDWLRQWQSRIDAIDMAWQQTSRLSGTVEDYILSGEGMLQIDQFVMAEIGLEVTESELNILSNNNQLSLDGLLKNKQGEVTFKGDMTLWPSIDFIAQLSGDNLTVIDTTEQTLVLSPRIKASYSENKLTVTGDIVFNQASLTMNKLPVTATNISEDQVFLDQPLDKDKSFSYDIALNLSGDDVRFNGFGLSSQLMGRLKLLAQKGRTINLDGELQLVNGQFDAYKQSLTIEQGQLIFLGSATNPGIQFTATRTIDDIKVGVIADGTLLEPRLKLFSLPVMPEENILALMITGRSIESLTANEGNALANAALSIGVEGANRIMQKISETLGMQGIEVTAKSTATTSSVNIQTQINDRLTAGYGTTIDSQNETQSGWIIEYRLSPKISVEAISGREVSANITYKNQFNSQKTKSERSESK
jgi:hypothetical protein